MSVFALSCVNRTGVDVVVAAVCGRGGEVVECIERVCSRPPQRLHRQPKFVLHGPGQRITTTTTILTLAPIPDVVVTAIVIGRLVVVGPKAEHVQTLLHRLLLLGPVGVELEDVIRWGDTHLVGWLCSLLAKLIFQPVMLREKGGC